MEAACWLLLALGVLGAADVFLFHGGAQRIRQNPASRGELVTHALRGPIYLALFLGVPNVSFRGAWLGALLGLLALDLAVSLADFTLERESRKSLGGLPTGEYLIHIAMAGVYGALLAAVARDVPGLWVQPTALVLEAVGPAVLRLALAAMGVGAAMSGALDARAVLRLGRNTRSQSRCPSVKGELGAPRSARWHAARALRLDVPLPASAPARSDGPPGSRAGNKAVPAGFVRARDP